MLDKKNDMVNIIKVIEHELLKKNCYLYKDIPFYTILSHFKIYFLSMNFILNLVFPKLFFAASISAFFLLLPRPSP